jgi:heme a synthase
LSHRHRRRATVLANVVPTLRKVMVEHRLSTLVAFAVFALLVIGGTVNPTGSSLACPEPTLVCHGQLFPPMEGGVFYEHGHRLAAMTVGLLQLALSAALFLSRTRSRRRNVVLGGVLLVMLGIQAALGAITVQYKLPWYISTAHLMLGMSYFATLIYAAFYTRRAPTVVELDQRDRRLDELGAARRWIVVACVAVFAQLLLGALVRHHGAAMVCLGMPSCTMGGDWFPEAGVQQLHMIHRGFGVVVALVTTVAAVQVWRAARGWAALRVLALIAPLLVVAQVALGVLTVMTIRSVPVAVGHFAGAAALWALWISAFLLTLRPAARASRIGRLGPTGAA